MKPWSKLAIVSGGLIVLGAPAVHTCRVHGVGALIGNGFIANAAEAAPSLRWENLRALDFQTGNVPADLKKHDGAIVRVPGFIIPLEDNERSVSEFLLVPYPLACIHVPAPPPNQIVHVKMDRGKKVNYDFFEPVWAQGRLKIQKTANMYTDSSFFMTGMTIEPYREKK